jgi:hypothetical protein
MASQAEGIDIIGMAFGLADAVGRWSERAKAFFYEAVLLNRCCPACQGPLGMVKEGLCRCRLCGGEFDPTPAFQQCEACGGPLTVAVRRYRCRQCGTDAASRFLFNGLVFDAEYFRQKMAEYRSRRQELRERVRQALAGSRSQDLALAGAELSDVPGLVEALNDLTAEMPLADLAVGTVPWSLPRYMSHLQAHIGAIAIRFECLPPLTEDRRLDRIRRFIAIIFMASAGLIDAWQEGPDIWVKKHETDRKGQGVPGDIEDADGLQGPVRGVESW